MLACVYGGLNEELLMRLFVFSLVLWLLQKVTRKEARSSTALFWVGNIIVAFLFAIAYLPAAAKLIELTPFAIFAIIFLKGAAGLVFGYLCWVRGLEAAMVAHFCADFVLHIIAPLSSSSPLAHNAAAIRRATRAMPAGMLRRRVVQRDLFAGLDVS